MKLYVVAPKLNLAFVACCLLILISSQKINAFAPVASAVAPQPVVVQPSQIKSYREWKATILNEAELRIKNTKDSFLKTQNASSTTEAGLSSNLNTIQETLDKENLQLSLAKDLSISDYFVGYLIKQKSISQAIKEVSGRLSAEEVAELMTAYANNFFSSTPRSVGAAPRADSGL